MADDEIYIVNTVTPDCLSLRIRHIVLFARAVPCLRPTLPLEKRIPHATGLREAIIGWACDGWRRRPFPQRRQDYRGSLEVDTGPHDINGVCCVEMRLPRALLARESSSSFLHSSS